MQLQCGTNLGLVIMFVVDDLAPISYGAKSSAAYMMKSWDFFFQDFVL